MMGKTVLTVFPVLFWRRTVFKSVFTKYISAFMGIVLISFLVLAVVLTSTVSRYAQEAKESLIATTAENTVESLYAYMRLTDSDFFYFSQIFKTEVQDLFDRNANHAEALIFLTDAQGNILLSSQTENSNYYRKDTLDFAVMNALYADSRSYDYSTLGGLFKSPHVNHFYPIIRTDESGRELAAGALFISSATPQMASGVGAMSRTILVATLWITLIALVATYLISDRITRPLKDISRAAGEFAAGNFSVRVVVKGQDEIAELCETFNNMADSLSKQEDLRNTFLANVSHDLRTPMTTIAGFIDGILDGAIPPEKQSYYLSLVAGEVRRLSKLVGSLLDVSRLQAGERKYNRTAFDVCEKARQILISFEKSIEEKELDVEFFCDRDNMNVYADADAIHQVLYNLCDNAVKFSAVRGELKISITAQQKKVRVSVYNSGEGIPAQDLPYVFERFYKSDRSRGLDKSGTGLGLFIAKTIITQHAEEIFVRSEEGKFCEFSFTLPQVVSGGRIAPTE